MTKHKPYIFRSLISFLLLISFIFIYPVDVQSTTVVKNVTKKELVLVKDYTKNFVIDMKYATCNNFTGKTLYPSPTCVLTKGTLEKLTKANNLVMKQGYKIKIWDAYRPLSVQKIMWDATPDKKYVANPYGSGSNDKNKIESLRFIKESSISQLIVVTSQLINSSNVVISTYEKKNNVWVNVHRDIPGYIGLKGFSLNKQEEDKKTPVGAFKIGTCFSKSLNVETGLNIYKYDSKDVWVDDPGSKYYNTHQREPVNGRWRSSENFSKVKNGVYDVFFNIEYNNARVKNKGSAIFFHIANPTVSIKYTNGCVSADRQNLLKIVKWLNKDKNPMILQGPLYEIGKY